MRCFGLYTLGLTKYKITTNSTIPGHKRLQLRISNKPDAKFHCIFDYFTSRETYGKEKTPFYHRSKNHTQPTQPPSISNHGTYLALKISENEEDCYKSLIPHP